MLIIYKIMYRFVVIGRENVPSGGFLVCANHSGLADPIFAGISLDTSVKVSIMAKAELFKFAPLGFMLKHLNAFPVRRGEADMSAMKEALRAIKNGGRLILFPEGTRNSESGAKAGAGMIAQRTACPILPMYITPRRGFLKKVKVIIGSIFYAKEDVQAESATERYKAVADDILEKIYALKPESEAEK